ncbi:hypothetical protein ABPG72_008285 [Tetrahymena utriculariae]
MSINESKKRVQFVSLNEESNNLPMKEKKLIQINGNQKQIEAKQNEHEGVRLDPLYQVVRYDFKEEIDKILALIDQRQSVRLQKISSLIQQQSKENNDILFELKELKEENQKQQQLITKQMLQEELSQKQGSKSKQIFQKQLDGYNNHTSTNMNKQRHSISRVKLSQFEEENDNQQQDFIENQLFTGNNRNDNFINNQKNQLEDQQQNLKQINQYNSFSPPQGLNEQNIKEYLERTGVYTSLKSNIQVQFFQKKVENYNEELVEGYYFKILKYQLINYEFYLYQIQNINEIEYNPIVVSNQLINQEESYSQLNDFYSVLSFPVPMLQGFFESFIQFILSD